MSHIREVPDAWRNFLLLEDTPADYAALGGQFVRINATPDGLEFTDDVLQKSGGTMTGDLILNADPTNDLGAVTKQYVDGLASGLDWKESVRVATTAAITLSGEQTIDGVGVVAGDRVLVKDQGTGIDAANGIYVCVDGAAWTRAEDADEDDEVTAGMAMFVEEGTANKDTGWVLITNDPITVGTTALQFTIFAGAGDYTAGTGLTESPARTFNVDFEDTDGNILGLGTADAGVSDLVARADHVHPHGDQGGGTEHDEATTSVAGFLSATDKTKLDAILAALDAGTVDGQTLVWNTDTWEASSNLFNDVTNSFVGVNTASPHSTIHANGSFAADLVTVTASYDLTLSTNQHVRTIIVNNAASATIALPSAVGIEGREYHIKKVSATGGGRTVVIDANGSETIDGNLTQTLTSQNEALTLVSDGANWWIV